MKPSEKQIAFVHPYDNEFSPVDGLVATDGVQYSAIATIGTTAVAVFSKLIDPGFTVALQKAYAQLTAQMTGLNGSFVGSIFYYWTAQPVYTEVGGTVSAPYRKTGAALNVTGTYQKAVGTLTTHEDTFSGNIPVASLPFAPFLLTLNVRGIQAAVVSAKVKNSSRVVIIGTIIPGT